MEEDYYDEDYYDEDYENEEDSEPLILTIGKDGKADIKKPSDYIELEKKDFELIKEFIEGEGKEAFNNFLKKKGKLNDVSLGDKE